MTKAQAFKAMQKKHGTRAAVRDSRTPSFEAARVEARARLKARGPRPKNDPVAARQWDEDTKEDRGTLLHYRFAVGYIMPYLGAFLVQGQGDTWAEAVTRAGEM